MLRRFSREEREGREVLNENVESFERTVDRGGFKMDAQIQAKIIESIQYFDSFQLTEVLDFVEYLRYKNKEQHKSLDSIDLLFGKYRDKLSSSDMFAKSKQAEKKKEEMKWKRK